MRLNPVLVAAGLTLGLSLPALAQSVTVAHEHQGHSRDAACGDDCASHHAKGKGGDCCPTDGSKADCCEPDGKAECCAPGTHANKAAACDHAGKDCDDACRKACEAGEKTCADAHHRHGMRRHRMERRHMMGHGRHHGGKHKGGSFGVRYFMNQPQGASFVMLNMERVKTFGRKSMWWNPGIGMGCALGMDPFVQTVNRHLGFAGPIVQNTMHFGPVNLTLGVQGAFGAGFDTTPTLDFQNAHHFLALDPRVGLGVQLAPRAAVQLTGSYLFTTRPAAIGGPAASLSLRYGF